MFNCEFQKENSVLHLKISGRIDSSNAADAEKAIGEAVDGETPSIIIDASELSYISSAGLRVILRLKKAIGDLKIKNVKNDVYDIFEMTGFTQMIEISKAYRKVSIDGCEVIGEGANGIVYRIDPDTIVKVYKNHDALEEIHNERELARKAFVMGVPTAIPYDVVQVGDLYGSVFELLNAKSFAKLLIEEPSRADELAKQSVEILKTMHETSLQPNELPDKKQEALVWAEFSRNFLPKETSSKLRDLVSNIPNTTNMLHGDFHIKNIEHQNGENLLIDMDTLSMGHPIFEFAAIFLAYVGFSCIDKENVKNFLGIDYDTANKFWKSTLKYYFDTEDEEYLLQIENKAAIIGYARLLRRTARRNAANEEYNNKLIDYCKNELIELVEKTDSLSF